MIRLLALLMALLQGGMFYPATLTVTQVKDGYVTMSDRRGHEYQLEEAEAWEKGDLASCIMYSQGTLDRSDDEILAAEYVWR